MSGVVAGVDLGGTATRLVIYGLEGVAASRTVATAKFGLLEAPHRISLLGNLIRALVPGGRCLKAIGIGSTGPVDRNTGEIDNHDTLPMFSGIGLVNELRRHFQLPVVIDNDAVVAAFAEHRIGAGQAAYRMLMVTLGTGIGVALLVDGKPFAGPSEAHPEAGHIPVVSTGVLCYCGAEGCWETVASRSALQAALRPHVPTDVADSDVLAAAAASASDAGIADIFDRYGEMLGRGLAALHTVYMPEVTILGGSASAYYYLFERGLSRSLHRMSPFSVRVEVRLAACAVEAGAVGAALMADAALSI